MRVVQRRQLNIFTFNVLPHIKLCPVADREHAKVFTGLDAGVKQRPQLRALGLGLPLAKGIAVRKNALFGSGFFFITACTAYQRIKAKLVNGFEQGH